MKPVLLIFPIAALALAGCKPPQPMPGPLPGPNVLNQPVQDSNNAGAQAISYELHQIKDGDTVAFSYVMPKGWTPQDKLQWIQTSPPYPYAEMVAKSPDKSHAIAVYPFAAGVKQTGPTGTTGQSYASAGEAIDKICGANPQIQNYQVVNESNQDVQSNWPQMEGMQTHATVAMKRIHFSEDGVEKEGFVIARYDESSMGGGQYATGATLWNLTVKIMTAPMGQLTTDSTFLHQAATMFSSASITPEYNKVWGQMSFDASQAARKVALEQDKNIMENYWNQQKTMEKGMKDFDDYIRGVSTYGQSGGGGGNGGNGPQYTLPSGGHYWIDPQGNIQAAPDPNYDPNQQQGNGNNWTPLNQLPG